MQYDPNRELVDYEAELWTAQRFSDDEESALQRIGSVSNNTNFERNSNMLTRLSFAGVINNDSFSD